MSARLSPRIETIAPEVLPSVDAPPVHAWRVGNRVGEGPAWHPAHGCLYWIDVRGKQLLRLRPAGRELARWDLPEVVGALALSDGDRACLAFPHRLAALDLASGALTDIAVVEPERAGNRLNDGKVSPSGRWFVFGSMDDAPRKAATGGLHRLDGDGTVRRLHDGLVVANGIAWSPDATKLYFCDSFAGVLFVADWNEASGDMGAPSELARLDEAGGRPDGAAVDRAGRYWSAGVSAGCINVFDGEGMRVRRIALPCRAPTMPAFAGSGSSTMFVTSLVRPDWNEVGPGDGALLQFDAGTQGEVPPLFRLAR